MAKFDAGVAVEALEYDFTAYGGKEGRIPEPTTRLVNDFFDEMRGLLQEAQRAKSAAEGVQLEEMSEEEMAGALDKVDEGMAATTNFQERTVKAIAILCQDSPSADELMALPYRVLSQFNQWLIGEIAPKSKGQEAPSPRQPQDHQRAGASRKRR